MSERVSDKGRPHSSPLPRISPKVVIPPPGQLSRQSTGNILQINSSPAAVAAAKADCLVMYEFQRVSYCRAKMATDYFLFCCSAKQGQFSFRDIEEIFEQPRYFSRPTRTDVRHFHMLSWLGQVIHKSRHSAESWFKSASMNGSTISYNEFSASVLLQAVQCQEELMQESEVRELFDFITDDPRKQAFTRHDVAFAFRRSRLSGMEMDKLNQTAMLLAELTNFLFNCGTRLRDFYRKLLKDDPSANTAALAPSPQHHHHYHHISSLASEDTYDSSSRRGGGRSRVLPTIGIAQTTAVLVLILHYQGRRQGHPAFSSTNRLSPMALSMSPEHYARTPTSPPTRQRTPFTSPEIHFPVPTPVDTEPQTAQKQPRPQSGHGSSSKRAQSSQSGRHARPTTPGSARPKTPMSPFNLPRPTLPKT